MELDIYVIPYCYMCRLIVYFCLIMLTWHLSGEGGGVIMVYLTSYFVETRGDNKEIKVIFFDFLCYYNYIFVDQEGGCVGMAEGSVIFAKV